MKSLWGLRIALLCIAIATLAFKAEAQPDFKGSSWKDDQTTGNGNGNGNGRKPKDDPVEQPTDCGYETECVLNSSGFTSLESMASTAGSLKYHFIIDSQLAVHSSAQSRALSLPPNISVEVLATGRLIIPAETELSIAGVYQAPLSQVFIYEAETSRVTYLNVSRVVPQWWGAMGDGVSNDTDAFKYVSDYINHRSGGHLFIPAGTYIVGKQEFAGQTGLSYAYKSDNIIEITACANPVVIEGEVGTKIKFADGLRYGSFDPETGLRYDPSSSSFTNPDYRAYLRAMVALNGNADVTVRQLELDGNMDNIILGGEWGPGRQLWAYGLHVANNHKINLSNIHTHHQAMDGVYIAYKNLTELDPPHPHYLDNIVSEYNARQGLSWVGGNHLVVTNSKFNHTQKGRFRSPPGAGLDIEPNAGQMVRNGYFENVEFVNNGGPGMVADSGDGGYTTFKNCLFWGTTKWAIWPSKPGLVFEDSRVYGSSSNFYGNADPALANQFRRVEFEDKPHPDYGVYTRYALITADADNLVIEDSTITANGLKSVYFDGNETRETLRNTTVIQRQPYPDKHFVALARGVKFENASFYLETPTFPETGWYVGGDNYDVSGGLYLQEPYLRLGNPVSGRTGYIE